MINDSYSASCYIEKNDGQYHIECDMATDKVQCYAEYDGQSFVDGFNYIVEELTAQIEDMKIEEEPPREETAEDKIKYLEQVIYDLREERAALVNELKNYKTNAKKAPYHSTEYYNELFDQIIRNLRSY